MDVFHRSTHSQYTKRAGLWYALLTLQDLPDALVPYLRGGETLQGGDEGVAAGVQEQAAGLEVAAVGRPVQGRLAQVVQGVYLQGGEELRSDTSQN